MFLARIVGLSIGLSLTIGAQAQPSKAQAQTETPRKTQQPPSQSDKVKEPVPFASLTQFSATLVGSLLGNTDDTKVYRSGKVMRVDSWNKMNFFVTNLSTNETFVVLRQPKLN